MTVTRYSQLFFVMQCWWETGLREDFACHDRQLIAFLRFCILSL